MTRLLRRKLFKSGVVTTSSKCWPTKPTSGRAKRRAPLMVAVMSASGRVLPPDASRGGDRSPPQS